MNKTQKGFALIEGLLIILILAIIGFGGYYVWHSQKTADTSLTQANQVSQSATASTTSPQAYLTIKEWGVKFKTNDQTKDAYVVFRADSNNQYLNLDSKDLDALTAYDGNSCSGEYIAILGRYAKDDPALTNNGIEGAIGVRKTVGAYVYTFTTTKQYAAACLYDASQNPITANKAIYDKKVTAYTSMYDTISAE